MKVVHRANTCFSIFVEDTHILFDPWLDGPAVAQGWAHFPPSEYTISSIPPPDLLYISHIHDDHCESLTLEGIERDTPIICMNLGPNFLSKMLKKRGFNNVDLLNEKEVKKIDLGLDIEAEVFGSSRGHLTSNILDSGIVLKIQDKIIVNFNDNHPTQEECDYIKTKFKKIDLAFIPCGGGSGYPAMYENISLSDKKKIVNETLSNFDLMFSNAVDILKPDMAIPVAGGFAIRGNHPSETNYLQIRHLDENNTLNFHIQNGCHKDTKIFLMQPGMELDVTKKEITKGEYKVWSQDELDTYFERLSSEKIENKVTSTEKIPNLFNMLKLARNNMWTGQNRNNMFLDYTIYIENSCSKELFEIPVEKNEVFQVEAVNETKSYLKLSLSQDTLLEWLLGYEDFNMLDSGHRISFYRKPNDYHVEAYYILSLFRL